MYKSIQNVEWFDMLARVLLRCAVLGYILMMLWFGMYMLAGELIYVVHGGMFGLSLHELNVIHYCGMAFVKVGVTIFFLFPWIAIRLVLQKRPA
jgi:hypothetical protein